MIENTGNINIEEADDANIPVDIWLKPYADTEIDQFPIYEGEQDTTNLWCLCANNYMPRKARLSGEGAYIVWGTKEELQEIIRKYIIPLYQVALKILKGISNGNGFTHLYYWSEALAEY